MKLHSRSTMLILSLLLSLAVASGCATPASDDDRASSDHETPGVVHEPIDAGLTSFREPTGDWFEAGDAVSDPSDSRRLAPGAGTGALINGEAGRTKHLITALEHGDVDLHLEFVVPEGSNSGVYLMGRYEIQVLDSFGKEDPQHDDCGGVYQRWDPARGAGNEGFDGVPPRTNASRPPGKWQTYDILFRAPRFDDAGNKTENARFLRVEHNGVLIHENVEAPGPTRAALFNDERPLGPLMLQGDHGPVAYRNLRMRLAPDGAR